MYDLVGDPDAKEWMEKARAQLGRTGASGARDPDVAIRRPGCGDSMSEERAYGSPTAFRRALTDRLTAMAEQGAWSLPALQRQFAYDRLLARLYMVDDGWVVKGATALLAREIGVRGTKDVDIFRKEAPAVAEVRQAAEVDLGDWCRFEMGPSRAATQGTKGVRIPTNSGSTEPTTPHG